MSRFLDLTRDLMDVDAEIEELSQLNNDRLAELRVQRQGLANRLRNTFAAQVFCYK